MFPFCFVCLSLSAFSSPAVSLEAKPLAGITQILSLAGFGWIRQERNTSRDQAGCFFPTPCFRASCHYLHCGAQDHSSRQIAPIPLLPNLSKLQLSPGTQDKWSSLDPSAVKVRVSCGCWSLGTLASLVCSLIIVSK